MADKPSPKNAGKFLAIILDWADAHPELVEMYKQRQAAKLEAAKAQTASAPVESMA